MKAHNAGDDLGGGENGQRAAGRDDMDNLSELLPSGVDIDYYNEHGNTSLILWTMENCGGSFKQRSEHGPPRQGWLDSIDDCM